MNNKFDLDDFLYTIPLDNSAQPKLDPEWLTLSKLEERESVFMSKKLKFGCHTFLQLPLILLLLLGLLHLLLLHHHHQLLHQCPHLLEDHHPLLHHQMICPHHHILLPCLCQLSLCLVEVPELIMDS